MAAPITVDPVFKTAGKKPGLEIWHIEKMKVKPLEARLYGKFNIGDAYIVLNTQKDMKFNIHFWLGKNVALDEGGVAAYKCVELDHSLGGSAVQYREVQEHESKQFLSYFITGVTYVEQESSSGMKHVEKDVYNPRLFHVKGRRNIRVVPTKLSWFSMNSGDVFIIDFGLTIYVWNGSGSTHVEKMKALDAAMRLRDEERGGAKIEIIEEKSMPADFIKQMNATAEGTPRDIQKEVDDLTYEKKAKELVKLYKVTDVSGDVQIDEVGSYPLKRELLNSKSSYVVDTGSTAIYVWLGKGSSHQERKAAFKTALDFIQTKGYPSWTIVTSVLEGAEHFTFKQNFSDWVNKEEVPAPVVAKPRNSIGSSLPTKFDVSRILQRGTRESQKLVDGGTGKVEIWFAEKSEMVPVDPQMYGHFFAEDTYVIHYTYNTDTERHIIYFWLGQTSSPAAKAAAALHTVDLNKKLKGAAVLIRVVQNKEPDHFMLIFKGKMIIHSKGSAAGHKGRLGKKTYEADSISLFQVHGTNDYNLRAIQVPEKASSLNSNDCYVLECQSQTFIWYGKVCSGDARLMANYVSTAVSPGRETINLHEGQEPSNFWKALGGKSEYPTTPLGVSNVPAHPARLFQCSSASGKFIVEEIFDFSQEDLISDDVMILDTYDQVFVWIGKDSLQSEQRDALEVAVKYIERDPSGRQLDSTLLLQVQQGFEPSTFTCHFFGWNSDLWSTIPSYADYTKLVNSGVTSGQSELNKYDKNTKYKYDDLKGGKVPSGVDPTVKEYHLNEADFKSTFGITIHEYRALPKWKQNNLKRKLDLY